MSKTKKTVFKGAATALITPFNGYDIDYKALGKIIDYQIEGGIDALVILGTTGESSTLSDYERKSILTYCAERVSKRVPIIAGTGTNNTEYSVRLSEFACSNGYDALLVVTPYYNKATSKGLIQSYLKIAESSSKPIILYNVPTRTGCNITPEVYYKLSLHENIVGIKEASGNFSALAKVISECSDRLDIYSGNDDQTLPILAMGGMGVISVLSNILPKEMHELCYRFFDGDYSGCIEMQNKYLKLMQAMFCEVNPIPIKTACHLKGLCRECFRLPLCTMEESNKEYLIDLLSEYNIITKQ